MRARLRGTISGKPNSDVIAVYVLSADSDVFEKSPLDLLPGGAQRGCRVAPPADRAVAELTALTGAPRLHLGNTLSIGG